MRTIPVALVAALALSIAALPGAPVGAEEPPPRPRAAIVLFDDVQIIDFAAPWEVLGPYYDIYTVAPSREPVTTVYGMRVIPDHDFESAPPADLILVPGGGKRYPGYDGPWMGLPYHPVEGPDVAGWVAERAKDAELVLSVCNGAFVLGKAGLLDGREATTTYSLQPLLAAAVPETRVVTDRRFVDEGEIITSGGLAAGIDAALHLVERLRGREAAVRRARGLEYRWDPDDGWARGRLADRLMPFRFDFDGPAWDWKVLSREGDVDAWTHRWTVAAEEEPAAVLRRFERAIEEGTTYRPSAGTWVRRPPIEGEEYDPLETLWTVTDEAGSAWTGRSSVAPVEEEADRLLLTLEVRRTGEPAG